MEKVMWLVWKHPQTKRKYKIGSLIYDNNMYTFKYINPELEDAILVGFCYFPGFEDINKTYTSDILFANIETRLPNSARADYLEILNSYGLDKNSTKLEILKATKGRLLTDNYEFVLAFDAKKVEFDVTNTKYCSDILACKQLIKVNDKLFLELETNNKYYANAIKVNLNKSGKIYQLGYVPQYYSKEIIELLKNNIEYSAMIQGFSLENELSDETLTVSVKIIFNS